MKWQYCKISDFSKSEYEGAYLSLSPSRKKRIDNLNTADGKTRSLAGELLLQKLLLTEFGITDATLETAPNGRPYLKNSQLYVSISHCEDTITCAVDTKPIGIDIEKIKPISSAVAKRICTPSEATYLSDTQLNNTEALTRFYEIWTGKEAYFKKCGTGITDFKSVDILTLKRNVYRIGEFMVQIVHE